MRRHRIRRLTLTLTMVLAAVAVPGTAQAAPYCGLVWGSQPEVGAGAAPADTDMVMGVRSGRHGCYDRLVVDLLGQDTTFGSYDVRYVPGVVEDGSGRTVPVRGAADLQITVLAPAYDGDGNATFTPANRREVVDVAGYRTFRQVAWAGSFEGSTTLALGVRARLPFRVFVLPGVARSDFGPRLVIDVAHRW
ncbi:AMIN-like domain-containing (lipo)protein [Blastococcus goldschmidtiae]|uniref:AMIN-like domain-containing protein n=1 Tax=Blastococcus goldschmidtiae TaxID=3075546 RepID=A0ABU2K653_9ACTN|nr:hypothetical protein [Blastococcus sp. DSM 46792]MDT0275676.1 hypothetical protein [Blastococcus sp. DSM 46792]